MQPAARGEPDEIVRPFLFAIDRYGPSRRQRERGSMEIVAAVGAALINLLAIALYHDKQAEVLNGTAAGLCAFIVVLSLWRRWRSK